MCSTLPGFAAASSSKTPCSRPCTRRPDGLVHHRFLLPVPFERQGGLHVVLHQTEDGAGALQAGAVATGTLVNRMPFRETKVRVAASTRTIGWVGCLTDRGEDLSALTMELASAHRGCIEKW